MSRFDCTVIVTAYEAANTIERCLRSVFAQRVGEARALLLVGYDESVDDTLHRLENLRGECPGWAEFRLLKTPGPAIEIGGRRTGRANFLNCWRQVEGRAILFCDGDDYWIDPHKLRRQLDCLDNDGLASYQPIGRARRKASYNPFRHGNRALLSSLCLPGPLALDDIGAKVRLLDWYLVCRAYQRCGLRALDALVRYCEKGGSWTSLSRRERIAGTLQSARHLLGDPRIACPNKLELLVYMARLSCYWLVDFALGRLVWTRKYS